MEQNDNTVYIELCKIIKNVIPKNEYNLSLETNLSSLGFNSMKYIMLFLSIEKVIGIKIEDIVDKVEIESMKNVGDLVKLINEFKIERRD